MGSGMFMEVDLEFLDIDIDGHELHFSVSIFGQVYNNTYDYEDTSLYALIERYGRVPIERICFHIVAFELIKYCSLGPQTISFGRHQKYCNKEFFQFWQYILRHVFSQWRYENNRPDDFGPQIAGGYSTVGFGAPINREAENDYLVFCGGGKDSLVAMRTLDAIEQAYGVFVYTHSIYGKAQQQVDLVKKLTAVTGGRELHLQHVTEDFLAGKGERQLSRLGLKSLLGAETPSSVFAALPIMLDKNYRCAVLAHERSADAGNMTWEVTGEEINHQWGKSWQAELAINRYISENLVSDYSYFSLLKPLSDVAVFGLLQYELDAIERIHSCNVEKPWCKRCAKCAYVWLGLKAYLPNDIVDPVFAEDLFDRPENLIWFRQLLGLDEHTPFECVGQVPETRLALVLYLSKNHHPVAESLRKEFSDDLLHIVDTFVRPSADHSNIDEPIRTRVMALFESRTRALHKQLNTILSHSISAPGMAEATLHA